MDFGYVRCVNSGMVCVNLPKLSRRGSSRSVIIKPGETKRLYPVDYNSSRVKKLIKCGILIDVTAKERLKARRAKRSSEVKKSFGKKEKPVAKSESKDIKTDSKKSDEYINRSCKWQRNQRLKPCTPMFLLSKNVGCHV